MWFSLFIFFFKQKTAYEVRISDWSSDVCSSDLPAMTDWRDLIRDVHDFPKPGIVFKDITPVLAYADAFNAAIEAMAAPWRGVVLDRSEERRVGKECVSKCRSRWSPCH